MGLPGSIHAVVAGTMCDEHSDRPAVIAVQGETDSMGYELHNMCDECRDKWREESAKPTMGYCAFCTCPRGTLPKPGTQQVELVPYRDPDEGSSGPVYRICKECRRKESARIQQELEDMEDLCCCGKTCCPEYDNHMDAFDNINGGNDEDY